MRLPYIGVAGFVASIFIDISIAESFGRGVGFMLGLIFLPTIFFPILAFKDAEYQKVDKN